MAGSGPNAATPPQNSRDRPGPQQSLGRVDEIGDPHERACYGRIDVRRAMCFATGTTLQSGELVDMAVLLLIAGHETTMNLIATGVPALARHPVQREILRAEPESSRHAVEEFLRFDSRP